MRSIIEKLYTAWISEKESDKYITEDEKREVEGFEDLTKTLSGDALTKFHSYTDILDEIYRGENEQAFHDGFIIGASLIMEILVKK